MAHRRKQLMADEVILNKTVMKKILRLKKKIRRTTLCNTSLKKTNEELVHMVQQLKEALNKADLKLTELNGQLVQALASKNSHKEKFCRLVSKIYGALADIALTDGSVAFGASQQGKSSSINVEDRENVTLKLCEKQTGSHTNEALEPPSPSTCTDAEGSSASAYSCRDLYRAKNTYTALSPLTEDSSHADGVDNENLNLESLREAEHQNTPLEQEPSSNLQTNVSCGGIVLKRELTEECSVNDNPEGNASLHEDESFHCSSEQKVAQFLVLEPKNIRVCDASFTDTIKRYLNYEDSTLREEAFGSLPIYINDPSNIGALENDLSSLPCPSCPEVEEALDSEMLDIKQNCDDPSALATFSNVFRRRRKALSPRPKSPHAYPNSIDGETTLVLATNNNESENISITESFVPESSPDISDGSKITSTPRIRVQNVLIQDNIPGTPQRISALKTSTPSRSAKISMRKKKIQDNVPGSPQRTPSSKKSTPSRTLRNEIKNLGLDNDLSEKRLLRSSSKTSNSRISKSQSDVNNSNTPVGRTRRRGAVCYKEPSLSKKLRR